MVTYLYIYSCCFIGHREIEITEELKIKLRTLIINLIVNYKVTNFLFGSKSQFDTLCYEIVSDLQKTYTHIKMICYACGSEQPCLKEEKEYFEKLLQNVAGRQVELMAFDDIIKDEKIKNAGKASYIERNYKMIDDSDYCVFYYSEEYNVKLKSRCHGMIQYNSKSGTRLAFEYANKKNKVVFNVKS